VTEFIRGKEIPLKILFNIQRLKIALCIIAGLFTISASTALAAEKAKPVAKTLITNVRIFDGESENLTESMSVLVEGNKISKIAQSIPTPEGATVIDAKGKVLMPGLIDAHWPCSISGPSAKC
jgi:adenine deaminase